MEIIATSNTTELKTANLDECVDFYKECTENKDNHFNGWKVWFKTLSMAAGELTFDDLPFDDNPTYVLMFALFIVLVLFVIMNLMTSVAVNDIQEIRNQSRDAGWYKLMLTLQWYHAAWYLIKKLCKTRHGVSDPDPNPDPKHMVHQRGRTYMEDLDKESSTGRFFIFSFFAFMIYILVQAFSMILNQQSK